MTATIEDDEIPPFLDRGLNGRARAYWTAHRRCPGDRIPHEYAMQNYKRFLARALERDLAEGKMPAHAALGEWPKPKEAPVRRRQPPPEIEALPKRVRPD